MASFTGDGVGKDDAHHFLGLAVAWKQAADALAAAEQAHAAILGTYYRGPATDFSQLDAARSPSRPARSAGPAGRT